jgi:nucleoid-associated protein YgaU
MAEKNDRVIKGKKFDRSFLDIAEKSVKNKIDGKISINDAQKILKPIKEGNEYTETEKRTIRYIRDKFKFTKEADQFFRKEISKWATKKNQGKKFVITRKPKDTKQKKSLGAILQKGVSQRGSIRQGSVTKIKRSSVKSSSAKTKITPLSAISSKISLPDSLTTEIKPATSRRYLHLGMGLSAIAILALLAYFYKNYSIEDAKKSPAISEEKDTKAISPTLKVDKPELEQNKKVTTPRKKEITETIKVDQKIVPASVPKKTIPLESKEFTYYTVKSGDQLANLSKQFLGDYAKWQKIYDLNRKNIQDPNLIYPSQVIKIPK